MTNRIDPLFLVLCVALSLSLPACGADDDAGTGDGLEADSIFPERQEPANSTNAVETNNAPGNTETNTNNQAETLPEENNSETQNPTNNSTEPTLADRVESEIIGSYVFKMEQYSMMEIPFLGPTEQVTTTYGTSSITRSGETFELTESGCHVESDAGSSVTTIVPDAIPRSTTATVSALEIIEANGEWSWTRSPSVTVIGVQLDNPASDALPTDDSDPRIFDQDGDGNPGVTVKVEGLASGDIYVVQRTKVRYLGGMIPQAGVLEAIVEGTNEQSVIGATNPLLQQNIASTPHSDAEKSKIRLQRVEETYDCDRVTDEAIALFPAG